MSDDDNGLIAERRAKLAALREAELFAGLGGQGAAGRDPGRDRAERDGVERGRRGLGP